MQLLPRFCRKENVLNFALFVLAVAGLWVSSLLLLAKLQNTHVSGCPGGGCNLVNSSPYALLLGVPVSLIGVVGYSLLALLCFLRGIIPEESFRKKAGMALVLGVIAAAFFTIYLVFTMLFRIQATCLWCLVSAGLVLTMTILVFFEYQLRKRGFLIVEAVPTLVAQAFTQRRRRRNLYFSVACVAVVGLIGLKSHYETVPKIPAPNPKIPNYRELDAPPGRALGPKDAPVLMAEFMNYECRHCRDLQPHLEKVLEKYKGKIRFLLHYYEIRNFPIGTFAQRLAEAVADQSEEAFWQFHSKALAVDPLTRESLLGLLRELNIDSKKAAADAEANQYASRFVEADAMVRKFHIHGVPTIIVNSRGIFWPNSGKTGEMARQVDSAIAQELAAATLETAE